MKKNIFIAITAVMTFAQATAFAATDVKEVTASASIQSALSLQMAINRTQSGTTTTGQSSLDFGALSPNAFGGMEPAGGRFFTVYLTGKSQQLPYVITQTGEDMSNGSTTLPDGAQFVVPVYAPVDNGAAPGNAQPVGSSVGTTGSWVATNKTIYDSENSNALERTVQAQYYLRGDPALGAGNFIPASQAAGSYSGQITFTLTA